MNLDEKSYDWLILNKSYKISIVILFLITYFQSDLI